MTDEEIAALAAYFGSLKAEATTNRVKRKGGQSMNTNRRQFLGGVGALAAAGALAMPAFAQAKPKVVVIGGGPGGATVAKYVAKDSAARST